jgi:hypothetical protein
VACSINGYAQLAYQNNRLLWLLNQWSQRCFYRYWHSWYFQQALDKYKSLNPVRLIMVACLILKSYRGDRVYIHPSLFAEFYSSEVFVWIYTLRHRCHTAPVKLRCSRFWRCVPKHCEIVSFNDAKNTSAEGSYTETRYVNHLCD